MAISGSSPDMGIYLITCTANGSVYVGSSCKIKKRLRLHVLDLKNNRHHSRIMQATWNKYGEKSFCFELIEPVRERAHLRAFEQSFIDYYRKIKNIMNINLIAYSPEGTKRTEETREKMRIRWADPVSRETRRLASLNKPPMSEETKAKLRASHTGRRHTKETKELLSKKSLEMWKEPGRIELFSSMAKGRKHSSESIQQMRKRGENKGIRVERIDPKTGEVKEYSSVKEAGRDGFRAPDIHSCLNGRLKSHRGFYWNRIGQVS